MEPQLQGRPQVGKGPAASRAFAHSLRARARARREISAPAVATAVVVVAATAAMLLLPACRAACRAACRVSARASSASAPPPPPSPVVADGFIARAAAAGASALLGAFTASASGFDRAAAGMTVERVESGSVLCKVVVEPHLQNSYSTLHGGATSTLVDIVGTLALLSVNPTRAGVSVELSVSFLSAAPAGATIFVEGRVLKTGKRLGFTTVDIFRHDAATGKRIDVATGRHTKSLG